MGALILDFAMLLSCCPLAIAMVVSPRYDALPKGRPASAAPLDGQNLARLVEHALIDVSSAAAAIKDTLGPPAATAPRVWLELSNGENLIVVFERLHDDTEDTTTMRVRQSRVTDECNLEDLSSCIDVGCIAVRWNLRTREGVLVDLFKAKKGDRVGCDISSADDQDVRWGPIILRVVDDLVALLGMKHVYLADESSVRLNVWNGRKEQAESVQVMLRYLRPLLRGLGYYEEYGGFYEGESKDGDYDASTERTDGHGGEQIRKAMATATEELNAFNAIRVAPFRGSGLADAIAGISGEGSRIHKFAEAMAALQEQRAADRPKALRAAAACADNNAVEPAEEGGGLEAFVLEHAAALDEEALGAEHLAELIELLYERNQQTSSEAGLKAGSLLLGLMFDVFEVWSPPPRSVPLKRKDYRTEPAGGTSGTRVKRSPAWSGGEISLGWSPLKPIIREAYFLCSDAADGKECMLPWA